MKLMLVTGFLGAGKTTFLKRLLPLYQHEKLALIINEFGKAGVDGTLLEHLGATLREIVGGSVFCSCRLDQFEKALTQAIAERPDMIFIEASGLSDPTAIRTILSAYSDVEYLGCVALCDAMRLEKALATVRVCPKQLAVSDLILLNKTDLCESSEVLRLSEMLAKRFPYARIEPTVDAAFDPQWLATLRAHAEQAPLEDAPDLTLQKACVTISEQISCAECAELLKLIAEDTYRMKGFLRLADGVFLADCVGASIRLIPAAEMETQNALVVLAGAGMPMRKALKMAREWYPNAITDITFG